MTYVAGCLYPLDLCWIHVESTSSASDIELREERRNVLQTHSCTRWIMHRRETNECAVSRADCHRPARRHQRHFVLLNHSADHCVLGMLPNPSPVAEVTLSEG